MSTWDMDRDGFVAIVLTDGTETWVRVSSVIRIGALYTEPEEDPISVVELDTGTIVEAAETPATILSRIQHVMKA